MTSTSTGLHTAAADTPQDATVTQPLWDAPVRLLHGLMALGLAGAWLTAEADGWRAVHIRYGFTLVGAMALRLVWGFIGSGPARFRHFVRGPAAVVAHLRDLLAGRAQPHAGHNPAGGWAVLALLAAGLATGGTGWLAWQGSNVGEELHEAVANGLLLLVGVHVAAVLLSSWLARDRLMPAMLTGRKAVPAGTPPTRSMHRGVAVAVLVATLGFWAWSLGSTSPWQGAGASGGEGHGEHQSGHHGKHDRDDD